MALMATDYEWRPIQDLPADWVVLTDSELPAIRQVYADLKALDPAATERWELQSRREWAIETGRVEGVYHWDRGTTETLMARGIIPDLIPRKGNVLEPEQIAAIIGDALEVLDGLFDFVKGDRQLSKSYIHELHQALLKNVHTYPVRNEDGVVTEQRLEKGVYKRYPNSVKTAEGARHAHCPPEHVEAEMDRLVEWHRRHVLDDVAPEVEAAWLHHRFTQIHPYPDGNGRVARALATLVLIKAGHFPMVIKTEGRDHYYDALLAADRGDLSLLVRKLRASQADDVVVLSQFAQPGVVPVEQVFSVDEAIRSIQNELINQGKASPPRWNDIEARISGLRKRATSRLQEVHLALLDALGPTVFEGRIVIPPMINWLIYSTLAFSGDGAELTGLNFHFKPAGDQLRGLAECNASFVAPGRQEKVAPGRFLMTYAEPIASQEARFNKWMEEAIVDGLQKWRASLRA